MTNIILRHSNPVTLQSQVNALITASSAATGPVIFNNQTGLFYQPLSDNFGKGHSYTLIVATSQAQFNTLLSSAPGIPLGDPFIDKYGRYIQACGGIQSSVENLTGAGATGLQILQGDTPAEVRAVMPFAINQVFRGSFTTTGSEATQLVTASNTEQVITFNTQQIPNADLGTLNNATGVFTAAKDITGIISYSAQIRRGLAGSTTWTIQVETSPDGVTWTPVAGSNRRILLGAGETNLVRFYDFTSATALPAGTQLRFTQSVSDSTNNTGLVALAAGVGGTTSAGFIFSLYSVE